MKTDAILRTAALVMAMLVAVAILALAGARPAQAAYPGSNGRIVFESNPVTPANPTGDYEIFTTKPDGSGVKQLTANTVADGQPSYSAGGGKIVYISYDGKYYQIYTISATGGAPKQITTDPTGKGFPSLSPDGKRIAYAALDGNDYEIYTIPASGGTPTQITDNNTSDYYPKWSPNGKRIAYSDKDGTDLEIYTISSSGGVPTKITDNTTDDITPAYSPDGKKIVYQSYYSDDNVQLYVVSSAGGVPRQITATTTGNYDPDWQPNFAPSVTKLSPGPGKTVRDRTPTIAATVRDGQQNLAKQNIKLSLDGRNIAGFSYNSTTDRLSFTPNRNLAFGTHRVRVSATDEFKLTGTRSWSFKVVR